MIQNIFIIINSYSYKQIYYFSNSNQPFLIIIISILSFINLNLINSFLLIFFIFFFN
jgi:hypothetical protein